MTFRLFSFIKMILRKRALVCYHKDFILQSTDHLNLDRLRGQEQTEANERKFEFSFSRANANSLLPSASVKDDSPNVYFQQIKI